MDITTQELEAFWRTLNSQDETDRAGALLKFAKAYLRQIAKNNDVDLDGRLSDADYKQSYKFVVLQAVKRSMVTPIDAPPATQWTQSASPYSENMTFSKPCK
jgi:hypothetical protein